MKITLTVALLGALCSSAFAAEDTTKDAKKVEKSSPGKTGKTGDPAGTWTWAMARPDGQSMERKLTLARQGEKLTGSASGRGGNDSPIEEGSFKNGQVAFKITREREGKKFTSAFQGKVEGDVIKGSMTMNRGDGERTVPWEAKRAK